VEIILIPERGFLFGARRLQRSGDVLDVVRVGRYEREGAAGPERRDDAGRSPAPVVPAEYGSFDSKRVHQREQVRAERRLLARARRRLGEKARRPIAAQIGNDDPRPGFGEDRRDFGVGVDVVREAVAHDAGPA
jgi:hypothetical protein